MPAATGVPSIYLLLVGRSAAAAPQGRGRWWGGGRSEPGYDALAEPIPIVFRPAQPCLGYPTPCQAVPSNRACAFSVLKDPCLQRMADHFLLTRHPVSF